MPTDKSQDKLDEILGQVLRTHSEPVPTDFTALVIKEIEQARQQEILEQVVLQERLTLAGCITFGLAVIVAALVFPARIVAVFQSYTESLTEQFSSLLGEIPQAVETVSTDWQFYTILALVLLFTIGSLVELFVDDSLRVA